MGSVLGPLGGGFLPTLADLFRERYVAAGVDFTSVRVHRGVEADQACRALGARAFTAGSDIYFAAGQFRPGTRDGLWLLAHEVAHVVQQSTGLARPAGAPASGRPAGSPASDGLASAPAFDGPGDDPAFDDPAADPALDDLGDDPAFDGPADDPALTGLANAPAFGRLATAPAFAGPAEAPAFAVLPPRTAQEQAADAAADAFVAGRGYVFGDGSAVRAAQRRAAGPRAAQQRAAGHRAAQRRAAGPRTAQQRAGQHGTAGQRAAGPVPVVQRYMAWEHSMLGDVDPARVRAAADGDQKPVSAYRDVLTELGRSPKEPDEERLRALDPGIETVRLPGSGLVLTLGELNVLPDYLGRPEEIETAPAGFIGPLIQSVRSWSIAELGRPPRPQAARGMLPLPRLAAPPRLLPGSLRYPLLGPLAETAEIAAISNLGRQQGFTPAHRYAAVLARNSGHFAPFSWYRWHSFHLMARELIERSAASTGRERETLRQRARICAGYADHFLQDSFAAGHLINKTLVIQWYIEWLAGHGVDYPVRDVLDTLTVQRQPLLHGPGHYDRAAARSAARLGGMPGTRAGGVADPPWDAQDVADIKAPEERIAASGVIGGSDAERHAAYQAYLVMLRSGTVQLAVKVAHEYLNKNSLVVSSGHLGHRFRLNGDHTLLAGPTGATRAADAAAASRRAIAELLRDGETAVDSWDIFNSFPDHVEQGGRMVSLTEWHRTGLRDLCSELFAQPTTRAVRGLMSALFRQLGTPVDDLE
jgi:hypothetical protein